MALVERRRAEAKAKEEKQTKGQKKGKQQKQQKSNPSHETTKSKQSPQKVKQKLPHFNLIECFSYPLFLFLIKTIVGRILNMCFYLLVIKLDTI